MQKVTILNIGIDNVLCLDFDSSFYSFSEEKHMEVINISSDEESASEPDVDLLFRYVLFLLFSVLT